MKFSIFQYPKLILKSYIFYIRNFEFKAVCKFSLYWPLILLLSIVNNIFLMLDHLLFNFKNIEIKSPLFIIGFPRSGTTFLHKIISIDTQFTTTRFWELMFAPSITQKYILNILSFILRPFNGMNLVNKIFNLFVISKSDTFHEIKLNNPEEDYLSLVPYASCFLLILFMPIDDIWKLNDFDNSFNDRDKNKLMRIYKRLIQRHLYVYGIDKIYLSKNPSFTSMTKSLKTHFPDCYQIGCHRDPHAAIPSLLSSMEHGYRIMSRKILDYNHVNLYIEMYKNYDFIIREQNRINTNFIAIKMDDLKYKLEETIKDIYNRFELMQSNQFIINLATESNKSKQYTSRHSYNIKDFNLNEENIKNEFKDYYSL